MIKFILVFVLGLVSLEGFNQIDDQRLIIVTTDWFRWHEVFKGMDEAILKIGPNKNDSAYIVGKYGGSSFEQKRHKLLPFLWGTVSKHGQLYGNRLYDNKVDNANPYWFSNPGYSELMTGMVDTLINSNDYQPNPHTNLLEFYNKKDSYHGKVAAFGAWEAFDRILNEQRASFPVISSFDDNQVALKDPQMKLISNMNKDSFRPFGNGECLDVFTHYQALTYLKVAQPKVLYISYGETDEWAHEGNYKFYLDAAHQFDAWVGEIWSYVQSLPAYKGKTTLLITTDHGRGDIIKDEWTSHGQAISDAHEIWFAIMGPKVNSLGEIKLKQQYFQKQLAQTVAQLTGMNYSCEHEVAEAIDLK